MIAEVGSKIVEVLMVEPCTTITGVNHLDTWIIVTVIATAIILLSNHEVILKVKEVTTILVVEVVDEVTSMAVDEVTSMAVVEVGEGAEGAESVGGLMTVLEEVEDEVGGVGDSTMIGKERVEKSVEQSLVEEVRKEENHFEHLMTCHHSTVKEIDLLIFRQEDTEFLQMRQSVMMYHRDEMDRETCLVMYQPIEIYHHNEGMEYVINLVIVQ